MAVRHQNVFPNLIKVLLTIIVIQLKNTKCYQRGRSKFFSCPAYNTHLNKKARLKPDSDKNIAITSEGDNENLVLAETYEQLFPASCSLDTRYRMSAERIL